MIPILNPEEKFLQFKNHIKYGDVWTFKDRRYRILELTTLNRVRFQEIRDDGRNPPYSETLESFLQSFRPEENTVSIFDIDPSNFYILLLDCFVDVVLIKDTTIKTMEAGVITADLPVIRSYVTYYVEAFSLVRKKNIKLYQHYLIMNL